MAGLKKKLVKIYRRLAQAQAKLRGHPFPFDRIDSSKLDAVIQGNRRALAEIENWLPERLLADSVFRYGVNPDIEPLINRPLDGEVTHADLLAYFGRAVGKRCRYLELGVSVGKSLWQVMQTCAPCECWGFDIEEINPAIRKELTQISHQEFPTPASSLKRTPSALTRFIHEKSGSTLTYLCADILDPEAWALLSGESFNLVLSDALHTADALAFEWEHLTSLNLLDREGVVVVWDDLDGEMRRWFDQNRASIKSHLGLGQGDLDTAYVNGWLGGQEFLHRLGIAIKSAQANAAE